MISLRGSVALVVLACSCRSSHSSSSSSITVTNTTADSSCSSSGKYVLGSRRVGFASLFLFLVGSRFLALCLPLFGPDLALAEAPAQLSQLQSLPTDAAPDRAAALAAALAAAVAVDVVVHFS